MVIRTFAVIAKTKSSRSLRRMYSDLYGIYYIIIQFVISYYTYVQNVH